MEYSAVLILPVALKDAGDAVAQAMGWGQIAYTIPLGADETVTHYACRADVSEQFTRWIRGDDPLPDPSIAPVVNALIWDFSPDPADPESPLLWGRDHLDAVLAVQGLVQVEV
jgi:hypothetical protein